MSSGLRAGRLFVVLLLAACHAAAQQQTTCSEWQSKFNSVQATWLGSATPRVQLERWFGTPTLVENKGVCTDLHYTITGCSCSFAVCSQGDRKSVV